MRIVLYLITLLLPVLGFGQMESEPNGSFGSATLITFGETIEGFIGEQEDEDYFELPVTEPGFFTITITGVQNINYRSTLYLPNRVTQIYRQYQSAENAGMIYEVSTCETGPHFLYFSDNFGFGNLGNDFNTTDPYFLTVEFTPFSEVDGCECENETISQACEIGPDTIINASFSPWFSRVGNTSTFDFDNYKVDITEPSLIRYTLISVPSNIDVLTQVFGPDQVTRLIERPGAEGLGYTLELSACQTGFYYFSLEDERDIGGTDFNGEEGYSFRVEVIPYAEIEDCECSNETLAQACEIENGATISAFIGPRTNFQTGSRDNDVYIIEANEPSIMRVNVTNVPEDIDLNLAITAPDQVELLYDRKRTTAFSLELTVCETGRYYLGFEDRTIFSTNFNSEEPYTFSVELTPLAPLENRECENGTIAEAVATEICDTIRALIAPPFSLEVSSPDEDFYSLDLEQELPYRVLLNNTPEGLSPRIYVYDQNGVLLEQFFPDEAGVINEMFVPSATEEYFFRVFERNGNFNSTDRYQLQIGCNQTVSNRHLTEILQADVYPNPTGDQLTVDVPLPLNTLGTITISDLSGRIIRRVPAGGTSTVVDMGASPPGIYLVSVIAGDRIYSGRFVKR